jgi:ribonuclease BN (tRNA processing enzyme)
MQRITVRAILIAAIITGLPLAALAQEPTASTSLWVTLGTQAGPLANPTRSQPANLLMRGSEAILVDTGDGTAEQLSKVGVSLNAISTIFLSHLHFDHTGGLAAIMGLRIQLKMLKPVTIYGPPGTKRLVEGLVEALHPIAEIGSGLSRPKIPRPEDSFKAVEITGGSQVQLGTLKVTAAENSHFAFKPGSPESRNKSLSYRFDMPDRSIVFTGDTGPSEAVEKLAKGADLLVSEMLDLDAQVAVIKVALASQPPSRIAEVAKHLNDHHLSPENVGKLAAAAGVKRLVVTHIGPGSHKIADIARYHGEIARSYHGPISVANDLDAF